MQEKKVAAAGAKEAEDPSLQAKFLHDDEAALDEELMKMLSDLKEGQRQEAKKAERSSKFSSSWMALRDLFAGVGSKWFGGC